MRRISHALLTLLALTFVLAACSKNPPPEPPPPVAPTTPPPAEEIAPPAEPELSAEEVLMRDGAMAEVTEFAYRNGFLGDVFFDFDKYELKADARDRLAKNAGWLNDNPQFTLQIQGHCDERGTNEYNLALGEKRANAARDYLTSLGVSASRIEVVSYGEEQPVCSLSAESCWAQNRRAHFELTGRR